MNEIKDQPEKDKLILGFILLGATIFILWITYPSILSWMDSERVAAPSPTIAATAKSNTTTVILPAKAGKALQQPQPIQITLSQPEPDAQTKTRNETIGEQYGTFGDSYGSFNALFSALAFTAVFFSLLVQSRALKTTQKDMGQQQRQIDLQNFNAQFFGLMELRNSKIMGLLTTYSKKDVEARLKRDFPGATESELEELIQKEFPKKPDQGLQVFKRYTEDLMGYIENYGEALTLEVINNHFSEKWLTYERTFSVNYALLNYFKIVFQICKTIYSSNFLDIKEKNEYKEVLTCLMSVQEYQILFLYGLCSKAHKEQIEKYALLEEEYSPNLVRIGLAYYDRKAFGSNQDWKKAFDDKKNSENVGQS